MADVPANPDVIIVGAGTSGLAAADALIKAGFEVIVLEAAPHAGGRCYTVPDPSGVPFDMGGSWLHSADINPLAKIAADRKATIHKTSWDECKWATSNGVSVSSGDLKEYNRYVPKMWQAARDAGQSGPDRPPSDVMPSSKWRDTARLLIAPMQGGDYDTTSVKDIAQYDHTDEDWLVQGGLGAFVASLFSDASVCLDCPVSKIDLSGRLVEVTTPKGMLSAKQVIITVSTGVLAAETISFNPPLPDRKLAAIQQLPNGLLNKIGLAFDPAWQEAHEGDMVDYHAGGEEFCTILFGFYGTSAAVGFVAGRFADELELEGESAATEFCIQGLRDTFGGDIVKYVRPTIETRWRSVPHALGSYSYALPGGAGARRILAEPIDDRLFFAGEATSALSYATVHGAYQSGLDTAKQIIAISNSSTL